MKPYYEDEVVTLHHGDCLDVLRTLPDASVDAVVTDPPYALEFMGRGWDKFTPLEFEVWVSQWAAECLRVLKPGGHMLAFGGSRTWHRLAAGIEDAGFEIRDSIAWLYGSGFPKSLDVSKAIDAVAPRAGMFDGFAAHYQERRMASRMTHGQVCTLGGFFGRVNHGGASVNWEKGHNVPTRAQWDILAPALGLSDEWLPLIERIEAEREVTGQHRAGVKTGAAGLTVGGTGKERRDNASTDAARQWEGWGTALKPAFEPVVVARKPLTGTVAGNVLAYGTGALNIGASRIATSPEDAKAMERANTPGSGRMKAGATPIGTFERSNPTGAMDTTAGRWPPNVALDESQAAELDEQTGILKSGANPTRRGSDKFRNAYGEFKGQREIEPARGADEGGASRFFPTFRYEAKAPTSERPKAGEVQHPTVKPLDLMRWLVRLVTPPGGVILEPFAGSGTTVEAAILEGFSCIAIEREQEYLPLIEQRLSKPLQQSLFDDMEGVA